MNGHTSRRAFLTTIGAGAAAMASIGALGLAGPPALRAATPPRRGGCGELLDPRHFGVVGDGLADDSDGLGAALAFSSAHGRTVFVPAGMTVRVAVNLFLHGNASLVGESRNTSRIVLGSTSRLTVPGRWVLCGVASASDPTPRTWTGRIENMQFLTEVPLRDVPVDRPQGELITFLAAKGFAFANCVVDQRPVGHRASNCLRSGFPPESICAAGPACVPSNGTVVGNMLLGSALGAIVGGGGAGINLNDARSIVIADNRIEGFADDAIAVISSHGCVVRDNRVRGIRSRIAAFSGADNTFLGNHLERQPGADGVWQPATTYYAAFLADVAARPSFSARAARITFVGNTAVQPANVPAGSEPADFVLLGGVDDCVVHGNLFVNDSADQAGRIRYAPIGLDPDGTPSVPGAVQLTHNVMTGAFPGTIEERVGSVPAGPFVYAGNLASSYVIDHPNSFRVSALTPGGACVDSNRIV